ncbi:hypothetical protein [Vibrio renipiscarius]|uniref:hypothetical protein n=1 Tax=Vibrio renipiscarius TaxID=1461322 RepID=UPI000595AA03|nr:hypothetical protein [Vibrio renipiscarius]KII79193.1 hypothetical protein PL18_10260 [Vibrio renipiscarius]
MFKKIIISILLFTTITACTTNQELYTGDDDEEFSTFNTIALPIVIVGVVAVAVIVIAGASQSGSGSSSSDYVYCKGNYCHQAAAWDYQPGNAQYRCRNTENGQFVSNYYCSGQYKQDNWY